MTERDDTGWWLQEPPKEEVRHLPAHSEDDEDFGTRTELDEDWMYDADQETEDARRSRELSLQNVDVVFDAKQPLPLFENVMVDDSGNFRVPERYIGHQKYGVWGFSVVGRRVTFKSRDEFGRIRFFHRGESDGGAIWVPHLYPFEEKDSNGLPLIKDRERCELTVLLSRIFGPKIYPLYTQIHADGQTYGAERDIEAIFMDGAIFSEFVCAGSEYIPESVEYPEKSWKTVGDYLEEKGRTEEYYDMMTGRTPIPDEYEQQFEANDWQVRQPSDLRVNRFGAIMVPVDDLRRGLDAEILFPFFREEKLKDDRGREIP